MKPCRVCGRLDNRIQIRAGTGICCNPCEKIEKKDVAKDQALDYLWPITTEYRAADVFYGYIKKMWKET